MPTATATKPIQYYFKGRDEVVRSVTRSDPIGETSDANDISILDANFLEENPEVRIWMPTTTFQITSQVVSPYLQSVAISRQYHGSCFVSDQRSKETYEQPILTNFFIFKDFWAVAKNLRGKTQLRELLLETYFKLTEYFDDHSQYVLEISRDVYEPEGEELFLRIVSRNGIERNLELLARFETDWWFERTGHFVGSPIVMLG